MIDLLSFRRALDALDVGLTALVSAPEDDIIRDACIHRFTYSYELSHKMLRRYLEAIELPDVDRLSFREMVQFGLERGLLRQSWDIWSEYRTANNNASYAFDEDCARALIEMLPAFAVEASFLCSEIQRQQSSRAVL